MGEALIYGGGGSSGLRNKPITKEAYENLSDADKQNPHVIWIITNDNGDDFHNTYGIEAVTKILCWEAYCNLSEEEKKDPDTIWVISDKTPEELSLLDITTNNGSKYYDLGGTPTSLDNRLDGVDYKLDKESTRPIANLAVTNKFIEIDKALGGFKFSLSESGGLRISYDDGE